MRLGTITLQPNERRNYTVQYGEALDSGDNINDVVACAVSPVGLTALATQITPEQVRVLVYGGANGTTYKITLRVATIYGEVFEDELMCKVKEI
jgi:hypothetical protein